MKKQKTGEPRGFRWNGGYGTFAYRDRATGATVVPLSQKLVSSLACDDIFKKFFNRV